MVLLDFFKKYWWALFITIPVLAYIVFLLNKKFGARVEYPELKCSKRETIGYSLMCVAMFFLTIDKLSHSPFLWIGFALICANLVLINMTYMKLYNKAKELLEKQKGNIA